LGIDVMPSDISAAHWLKASPKDKYQPMIVRFTNRRIHNLMFSAKNQLKTNSSDGSSDRVSFQNISKRTPQISLRSSEDKTWQANLCLTTRVWIIRKHTTDSAYGS